MFTVETANGQALDFVACGGHTLHLHTALGTYKQDFGIRAFLTYGIGNGYGRENMSARSATTYYDSQFFVHIATLYSILQK